MAIEIVKMETISGYTNVFPPRVPRSQRVHFVVLYICVAAFCREVFTANAASHAVRFLRRSTQPVLLGVPTNESVDPRERDTEEVPVAGIENSARRHQVIYGRALASPIPWTWRNTLVGGGFSRAEDAASVPPQATQEAFQEIRELVELLFDRFYRETPASKWTRALVAQMEHETLSRANDLVMSAVRDSPRRGHLGMLKPLFQSQNTIMAKSAYYGKDVDVTPGHGGLVIGVDGTETTYTPFLVCHDHGAALSKEAVIRMEEILAGELCISGPCSLDSLESLQQQHHLLTMKDIILFQGDTPFLYDSTGICAPAALLIDHTVSDLSLMLPVKAEPFARRNAVTAELTRFALFHEVTGVVGSLAASGLVLPRYSLQSFLIKASGSVYLKSVPQPRLEAHINRRLTLRPSCLDRFRRSSLRDDFNKSMNALDLVSIAYNIWCLTRECLLRFTPEAVHARRRILAALRQSSHHLPRFILKLLQELSRSNAVLNGLLAHPVYRRVGEMVKGYNT